MGGVRFHKDGTIPTNDEVFVFGSNLAGIHGAGAAKIATVRFGAVYGIGKGWQGNSYAIPTKDVALRKLPLHTIQADIENFVRLTNDPFILNYGYFVTRIGCGLANYKNEQIAPLFKGARKCSFAEEWKPYLE